MVCYALPMRPVGNFKAATGRLKRSYENHRNIDGLLAENARLKSELEAFSNPERRMRPENLVWIFGTARTGSTWVSRMLKALPYHELWNEPLVGDLLGNMPGKLWEYRLTRKDFVFSGGEDDSYESLRRFVLEAALRRLPGVGPRVKVLVKEPHGSHGSQVLLNAFPESRVIFLVRDPRDVAASGIDAHRPGGWAKLGGNSAGGIAGTRARQAEHEIERARSRGERYSRDIGITLPAYEAHRGPKTFVRYEDLRFDTGSEMSRVCDELALDVDPELLRKAVAGHDWDNIPEEKKGSGKTKRKATPEGWREDLTGDQIAEVERITGHLMDRLGYERSL